MASQILKMARGGASLATVRDYNVGCAASPWGPQSIKTVKFLKNVHYFVTFRLRYAPSLINIFNSVLFCLKIGASLYVVTVSDF